MAITHTVRQGECLSSIAVQYGFLDWENIYNDPANADFRRKRPNPNLICPGDQLIIPDRKRKMEECQTEKKHRFSLTGRTTLIRVRLEDRKGKPLANKPYRITVGQKSRDGQTTEEGLVEQEIDEKADKGKLEFWMDEDKSGESLEWELHIGHLDPAEENTGVQARLNNLGYDCNGVDGDLDDATQAALAVFQSRNGLTASGELDESTRKKLCEVHDGK